MLARLPGPVRAAVQRLLDMLIDVLVARGLVVRASTHARAMDALTRIAADGHHTPQAEAMIALAHIEVEGRR